MEHENNLEEIADTEDTGSGGVEAAQESVPTPDEMDPEAVALLQQELEECRSKREEYLDGWQRSLADFSNFKKRVEREQSDSYQRAAVRAAGRILEVLDDLELALKDRPLESDGAAWAAGIELIYRKILGFLEADAIVPMEAVGAQFDPNFHEAISTEDHPDFESGQIIETLQTGYLQNGKVVRPARVRVAS